MQNKMDKVPTCSDPTDPKSLYVRVMFRTSFLGPFKDAEEVADALRYLDSNFPMWDYDGFCIIYGADPLPEDYVCGFLFATKEVVERIEALRELK